MNRRFRPGLLPAEDLSGVFNNDFGLFLEWSAFLQLNWQFDAFSATINGTFLPGVDDVTLGEPYF